MKFTFVFLICTIFCISMNAQSFFGSVPKPKNIQQVTLLKKGQPLTALDIAVTETEKNLLRPVTNIASYIIGKDVKESSIITGAGVGYEHLKYNAATEKWNIVWSVNALLYGRIVLGNESNGKKLLSGISIGAFDNLLMVGYATDFKNSYGTIGVGIPLNNL